MSLLDEDLGRLFPEVRAFQIALAELNLQIYKKCKEVYKKRTLQQNVNSINDPNANWTHIGLIALHKVIEEQIEE